MGESDIPEDGSEKSLEPNDPVMPVVSVVSGDSTLPANAPLTTLRGKVLIRT
jgi:hypothetical protein